MLNWLQNALPSCTPETLLNHWNSMMERPESRADFFKKVVELANSTGRGIVLHTSPRQNDKGDPDRPDFNLVEIAKAYYDEYMKTSTQALTAFVHELFPQSPLVVTYFDEAHELKLSYWMLLRLASSQDRKLPMWYVFMGTQSSITYLSPGPQDMLSLRLRQEIGHLLEPYIALGFDQNLTSENRAQVTVRMGYLQSIKHLSRYGRPMWNAQFVEGEEDKLIDLAGLKLVGWVFLPQNRDHVLAVLSQRVCVDTLFVSAEALQLADRGVANHMRLLTGFSHNQRIFFTHSPSEPMLALGAARLVDNAGTPVLGQVLNTFTQQLCEPGLVEKGLLGELASRILLTVARDLAAPTTPDGPDLLKPVLLMDFLDELFGNKEWCDCRQDFKTAFGDTYVNFTHWVVTKDPLSEDSSQQLLANLWARGAALQFCFRQESLDLVIVTYKGSVAADAIFDVENLSAVVVQIKYKGKADTKVGRALRPIGIPRNIHRPLPYIALLMELGNQSNYQRTKSKILVTASPLEDDGTFGILWEGRASAMKELFDYKKKKRGQKQNKNEEGNLQQKVDDAQAKMDACNRFSIFVRGASPEVYGALHKAKISAEFARLLTVTMAFPTNQDTTMKYMHPLERLDETSDYTTWMSVYATEGEGEVGEEGRLMDVDS